MVGAFQNALIQHRKTAVNTDKKCLGTQKIQLKGLTRFMPLAKVIN